MYAFEDLKDIMAKLRAEDGCPWDREQTHESLKRRLVEECGEVLEAIDSGDTDNLCEELGDVLFQVMIHSEIEKEQGTFTVDDVVNGICEKMVRRHPHVFGDEKTRAAGVGENFWDEIKKKERETKEMRRKNGKKP